MGKLDQKVEPGQSVQLDADWHNELVTRLKEGRGPSRLILGTSSTQTVVHYSTSGNYPMHPSDVTISDLTKWGALDHDTVQVLWTLTGVGHLVGPSSESLTSLITGPGESITWTWDATDDPARSWDAAPSGRPLPTSVRVAATARVLALETNAESVASIDDLADVVPSMDGERRLVRDDSHVYLYDADAVSGDVAADSGGYWTVVMGPTWSTFDTSRVDIIIDRAVNPDYSDALQLRISPERETLELEGAIASVRFEDRSRFPQDVTTVQRTVTAEFIDNDGVSEGSDGLTVTDTAGELLAATDTSFGIESDREGLVRVTSSYDVYTAVDTFTTHSTRRLVRIYAQRRRRLPSMSQPVPPSRVRITPGNGQTRVEVGTPVTLTAFTATGTYLDESPIRLRRSSVSAGKLASRLSVPTAEINLSDKGYIDVADALRLAEAGDVIYSALAGATDRGLKTYTLTLTSTTDLRGLNAGELLYLPGATLRITRVTETTSTSATVQAQGYLAADATLPLDGHVSAAADVIVARLEFGYGKVDGAGFPRQTYTAERLIDPDAGTAVFDVALPRAVPESLHDAWHVKPTIAVSWLGEASVLEEGEWQPAETVPSTSVSVDLVETGTDAYAVALPETEYDLHGKIFWASSKEASAMSLDEAELLKASRIGPAPAVVPTALHDGAVLVVQGHYRTRGGTVQQAFRQATSKVVYPTGAPLLETEAENTPDQTAPTTNGVILKGPKKSWISAGGSWLPFSATTRLFPTLQNVLLAKSDGTPVVTSQVSATAFAGATEFEHGESLTITFVFGGDVTDCQLVDGQAASQFDLKAQTLTVTVPMLTRDSQSATVTKRYVCRAVPYEGETADFSFELTLSSTDTTPPVLTSVIAQGKDGTPVETTKISDVAWKLEWYSADQMAWTARLSFTDATSVVSAGLAPENTMPVVVYNFIGGDLIVTSQATKGRLAVEATDEGGNSRVYSIQVVDLSTQ